jgi:hypothetical protein
VLSIKDHPGGQLRLVADRGRIVNDGADLCPACMRDLKAFWETGRSKAET